MPESQSRQLLENLGRLRQSAGSHHSQLHLPRLSGSDLDFAVVHSGISWDLLNRSSYNIGKTMYRSVSKEEAPSSSSRTTATVGRKSKINDEKVIAYVRTTLHKYSNDSSKVVVVRHQGVKRLVCARLLTKRLGRIWQEEPELRKLVGISALRRIVRVHFPSYRKPGRKTDVCSHCRTFKRHIVPRAEKEYNKRRAALVSVAPNYFDSFDQDSNTVQLLESARTDEIIVHAWKYITSKNSQSATDASRKQLSVGTRLELFESEAKACHKLKGHCELLEAYSWHQQSAERQREFSKELLLNLPNNEAYLHFDFKENVRYPMAKEETGAEFHAQNKLSITVFGCTVYAPGRRNFNFLLLSEVLDHDSQMAKLLLSRILEVVRGKPEYEWSKDLLQCYRAGAQAMVNSDPAGPKFHIESFDPGEFRPDRSGCVEELFVALERFANEDDRDPVAQAPIVELLWSLSFEEMAVDRVAERSKASLMSLAGIMQRHEVQGMARLQARSDPRSVGLERS
ncbi:unnamed protein product [Durusdinium trenchii]|uniref:Uncharacterized protein n=1 Tax=Durusdinium trenchii TaxID=1381693 RepID=A0ABP0L873_9DINO